MEPEPGTAPPAQPQAAQAQQYAPGYGLNPCPWRVIDAAARKAECIAHGTPLTRREVPKKKGKGMNVFYSCDVADRNRNLPGYKPAPGSPFNTRGYCDTSGFVSQIFEGDVK